MLSECGFGNVSANLLRLDIGRKLWERYIEVCRDFKSLNGVSWMQLRSHLDALEMKKLYGLNPMAPEFVPKVLRSTGQPMIMASSSAAVAAAAAAAAAAAVAAAAAAASSSTMQSFNSSSGSGAPLPPLYPVPPTVFPTYPPPPPFSHPQWLIPCGQRSQMPVTGGPVAPAAVRNVRQRIVPMAGRTAAALASSKSSYAGPPPTGHLIPPPLSNTPYGNFNASMNSATFAQLNAQFQVSGRSPRRR